MAAAARKARARAAAGGGGCSSASRVSVSLALASGGVLLVFAALYYAGATSHADCVPGSPACGPTLHAAAQAHNTAAIPAPPPPPPPPPPAVAAVVAAGTATHDTDDDIEPEAVAAPSQSCAPDEDAPPPSQQQPPPPAPAPPAPPPPVAKLRGAERRKRVYFTITSGHSGTAWLAQVMECTLQRMRSVHEDQPSMVLFPTVLLEGAAATYATRRALKLPALRKVLDGLRLGAAYSNADHMFVKSWGDVALDWLTEVDPAGDRFDVVILVMRRRVPELLRSLLTVRSPWDASQPEAEYVGGMYTLHHRRFAKLPPLAARAATSKAAAGMGYIADLEEQYAAMRAAYPRFRYVEVRSEQLLDMDGARAFLTHLGLAPVDNRCLAMVFQANKRHGHVVEVPPDQVAPLEAYAAHAQTFVSDYAARGIQLSLPHMGDAAPCSDGALLWCSLPATPLPPATVADLIARYPMAPS